MKIKDILNKLKTEANARSEELSAALKKNLSEVTENKNDIDNYLEKEDFIMRLNTALIIASIKVFRTQTLFWNIIFFSIFLDLLLLNYLPTLIGNLKLPQIPELLPFALSGLAVLLSFQNKITSLYRDLLHWQDNLHGTQKNKIFWLLIALAAIYPAIEFVAKFFEMDLVSVLVLLIVIAGNFLGFKKAKETKQDELTQEIYQVKVLAQLLLAPSYLARVANLVALVFLLQGGADTKIWALLPYFAVNAFIILSSKPSPELLAQNCRRCSRLWPKTHFIGNYCEFCHKKMPSH